MEYISYIADFFSIIAFGFTIWMLFNVKKVKELTKEAIRKFDRSFTIADISKAYKVTDEIQEYLSRGEFNLAVLRMNDMRVVLSQLQSVNERKEIINDEEYANLISNYYLHVENLKRFVANSDLKVKLNKISADLSIFSKMFLDLENKLKRRQ